MGAWTATRTPLHTDAHWHNHALAPWHRGKSKVVDAQPVIHRSATTAATATLHDKSKAVAARAAVGLPQAHDDHTAAVGLRFWFRS